MTTPNSRVEALQSETQQLTQFLTALPAEAWHHPSACDRWLVADVVSHLSGMGHKFAERLARGLQGDRSPSEGLPHLHEHDEDAHAETRTQRAIANRERLGNDLLASFIEGNEKLYQGLST